MNSRIAISLLWDLGPDPRATANTTLYLAAKEQTLIVSRFLSRVCPPTPYTVWGLDQALSKEILNGSFPFLSRFVAIRKL